MKFLLGAVVGAATTMVVMNHIYNNQKIVEEKMNKNSTTSPIKETSTPAEEPIVVEEPIKEEPIHAEKPIETETPKKEFPVFKVILNNIEITCHEGIDYDAVTSMNSFSNFLRVRPRIKSKFDLMLKRHLNLNIDDSIDFVDMFHITDYHKHGRPCPLYKIINTSVQITKPSEVLIIDTDNYTFDFKEYLLTGKQGTSLTTLKFALILNKLDVESAFNVFCEYLTEEEKESFMKDIIAAEIGDILYK